MAKQVYSTHLVSLVLLVELAVDLHHFGVGAGLQRVKCE